MKLNSPKTQRHAAPKAHTGLARCFLAPVFGLLVAAQSLAGTKDLPSLPVEELAPTNTTTQALDLTAPSEDLLARLRNGYAMPDLDNQLVTYYQQRYLSQPEYLRRMVDRSRRYMHHILDELEKRGMPTEIALLPMVESAMNPMAYSRAHASGLWQFIPSTGKSYNLTQDWWMDERRDVVASTNAALEYLSTIYELHGDWHLALASYNWGENAVGRAIRRNEAAGLPTDYDSLNMPKETRHYVPKLQALKNIFGSPALVAQLNLAPLDNKPYFTTLSHSKAMDVKVAAKLANMPVDEFVALNPAHNRPVIKADAQLVVPAEKASTFLENLKNYAEPLTSWNIHTLKLGERLDALANRLGVALADLKRVNGLYGQVKLAEGHILLIPGKDSTGSLDDVPNQMTSLAALATQTPSTAPRFHLVQKGDTLPRIANRYGLSLTDLKTLNHLKSATIKPGLRLALGSQTATNRPVQARAVNAATGARAAKSSRVASTRASKGNNRGVAKATPKPKGKKGRG